MKVTQIAVDGTITETLAKGLVKRMERELAARGQKEIDFLRTGKLKKMTVTKWRPAARTSLMNFLGEFLVGHHMLTKHIEQFFSLSHNPVSGAFNLMSTKLYYKKRASQTEVYKVCLSKHCVERYIERVGRAFTWHDIAMLAGEMLMQVVAQQERPGEPGEEVLVFVPEGVLCCNYGDDLCLVAKTFRGLKQMNAMQLAAWQAYEPFPEECYVTEEKE